MANTISNMKNPLKQFVSKHRRRYQQDGFNLDLSYILPNVIAMGYPAENFESIYRNNIDDVYKFLEKHHKDHYKIYNLCSERSYDITKFKEMVATYPFDDHNPPHIELIQKFCEDVSNWIGDNEKNVAAVHCKAGKGRTGTMICCYLLYKGLHKTADEALNYYGQQRTHDKKGVTIPSQRRYVGYYAKLLSCGKTYSRIPLQITEIRLSPLPLIINHQGTAYFSISYNSSGKEKKVFQSEIKKINANECIVITLDRCIALAGEVKIEFFIKPLLGKEKKLFHFWFNTFFTIEEYSIENTIKVLKMKRCDLDVAHKEKHHKNYPENFELQVSLQRTPPGPYTLGADAHLHNNHHDTNLATYPNIHTPSESPEASSSESSTGEDWESDWQHSWVNNYCSFY